jgi:hypothetical protein
MKHGKTIALSLSLALNAVCVAFFALALSSRSAALSLYDMGNSHTTAALAVSFPADSGSAVFGPVELRLAKGEQAALQFSAYARRSQANYLITALYDRSIIRHENTGYGIVITALKAGETVMQTLGSEGVADLAVITVTDE